MWARSLQPVVAGSVLSAIVLLGIACGNGEHDVVADTNTSSLARGDGELDETSSSSSRPSETWTTSSTLPPPAEPQPCGGITPPGGTEMRVTVVEGSSSCPDAEALIGIYYSDRPDPSEDPEQRLVIDGWECVTDGAAEPGPASTCTLPGYGVVTAAPDPS